MLKEGPRVKDHHSPVGVPRAIRRLDPAHDTLAPPC